MPKKLGQSAILSVHKSQKDGLGDFGNALATVGYDLIATRGTAECLREAGLEVTDIAEMIGTAPRCGHRFASMSWQACLGLMSTEDDIADLEAAGLPWVGLVVVGLYPTEVSGLNPAASWKNVIEDIDIGGPNLLKCCAKGALDGIGRVPIGRKEDWWSTIDWIRDGMPDRRRYLQGRAISTFRQVGAYYIAAANYLQTHEE